MSWRSRGRTTKGPNNPPTATRRHHPVNELAAREWHYFSPDSDPILDLVKSIKGDARRGDPDPVHATSAPATFARANALFAQLVENARTRALNDIKDDVTYVIHNATEALSIRKMPRDISPEARERTARLDAEFRRRLANLQVREAQHEAELAELAHAAKVTVTLLEGTWRAYHPHPDYLGHFDIPRFEMPVDAGEIGQGCVSEAIALATNQGRDHTGEDRGDRS